MSTGKKILIVFSAILLALCVAVDVWYLMIYLLAPEVVESNTVEVDLQTTADGGTVAPFIEVNYLTNENKNGFETFEVKFNYFMDEDQEILVSQGLQYVANSYENKINFQYCYDPSKENISQPEFHASGWYTIKDYYARFGSYLADSSTTNVYNYMSSDNYEHVFLSTDPLGNHSRFKLQIGSKDNTELLIMKFKGDNTSYEETPLISTEEGPYHFCVVFGYQDYYHYYSYYDVFYFVKLLYDSLQNKPHGTNTYAVFQFDDLFNYYKYDGEGSYIEITDHNESEKVIRDIKSYYKMKINISADGATSAKDSIFNCLNGSQNFNSGEVPTDDYFIGRTVIYPTIYDFDFVNLGGNYYSLKLSDEFVRYYSQFPELYLSIEIDLDKLRAMNIKYFGLTKDNGLDKFHILEIYTLETIDGEVVRTEVDYA